MKVAYPYILAVTTPSGNNVQSYHQSEQAALDAAGALLKGGHSNLVVFRALKHVRPKDSPVITEDIVVEDNGASTKK